MKNHAKQLPLLVLRIGLILVPGLLLSCATGDKGLITETSADDSITADAQCPVCGMYPARYKKFAPKVTFNDGKMVAFDGCKDMYRYLMDMDKYGQGRTKGDIRSIEVRNFSSGAWIDGRSAHYVSGSSVRGPMGPELIPFLSRNKAEAFQKKNGGELLTHEQIISKGIAALPGHMMMHH